MKLAEFIIEQKWAIGFSEIRRVHSANKLLINNKIPLTIFDEVNTGDVVRYGKHKERVV